MIEEKDKKILNKKHDALQADVKALMKKHGVSPIMFLGVVSHGSGSAIVGHVEGRREETMHMITEAIQGDKDLKRIIEMCMLTAL